MSEMETEPETETETETETKTKTKTKKGRFVEVVLKQVMEIIPESETNLINELNKFKRTLDYSAPEMRMASECWSPFISILNFFIPKKEEEWQLRIRDILTNQ